MQRDGPHLINKQATATCSAQAARVEAQKLKAIGARNAAATLEEVSRVLPIAYSVPNAGHQSLHPLCLCRDGSRGKGSNRVHCETNSSSWNGEGPRCSVSCVRFTAWCYADKTLVCSLLVEEQSLMRAKQEQDALIAQLTDSSTGADTAIL